MSSISVDVQGHIAVVTMDRPPVNALVKDSYIELREIFEGVSEIPGVRVAVLRSTGKAFCTGNDVQEFVGIETADQARAYAGIVSDGISAIYACKVPVVAAVHGHALGAGMAIAACADVIVAAPDALFGIPEIKVGVIGASAFLGLIVPEKVARYLALTGKSISATKVESYGGIQAIVPAPEVLDQAMSVAAEISSSAPQGVRYFKQAMNINQNAMLVEKYATESGFTAQYVGSSESRESVAAFMQNRAPDYD